MESCREDEYGEYHLQRKPGKHQMEYWKDEPHVQTHSSTAHVPSLCLSHSTLSYWFFPLQGQRIARPQTPLELPASWPNFPTVCPLRLPCSPCCFQCLQIPHTSLHTLFKINTLSQLQQRFSPVDASLQRAGTSQLVGIIVIPANSPMAFELALNTRTLRHRLVPRQENRVEVVERARLFSQVVKGAEETAESPWVGRGTVPFRFVGVADHRPWMVQ